MVLVLDTCHSAASVGGDDFRPGPMGDAGLGQLAYDKGMRVLAATQPGDAAVEHERLRKGLLSYTLIDEGLVQGRADWQPADGEIRLREWLSYGARHLGQLQERLVADARGLVFESIPPGNADAGTLRFRTHRGRPRSRPCAHASITFGACGIAPTDHASGCGSSSLASGRRPPASRSRRFLTGLLLFRPPWIQQHRGCTGSVEAVASLHFGYAETP